MLNLVSRNRIYLETNSVENIQTKFQALPSRTPLPYPFRRALPVALLPRHPLQYPP
jgi:hypothetical protein